MSRLGWQRPSMIRDMESLDASDATLFALQRLAVRPSIRVQNADDWERSTDAARMLQALKAFKPSERKLRMFCEACDPRMARWNDGSVISLDNGHSVASWFSGAIYFGTHIEAAPAFLRCIFGNPWRPAELCWRDPWFEAKANRRGEFERAMGQPFRCKDCKEIIDWNDRQAFKLAEVNYQDRRWQDMPILADALEEAGCRSELVLGHCRGLGPHTRGCWVLDQILGKE